MALYDSTTPSHETLNPLDFHRSTVAWASTEYQNSTSNLTDTSAK